MSGVFADLSRGSISDVLSVTIVWHESKYSHFHHGIGDGWDFCLAACEAVPDLGFHFLFRLGSILPQSVAKSDHLGPWDERNDMLVDGVDCCREGNLGLIIQDRYACEAGRET